MNGEYAAGQIYLRTGSMGLLRNGQDLVGLEASVTDGLVGAVAENVAVRARLDFHIVRLPGGRGVHIGAPSIDARLDGLAVCLART